MQHRPTGPCETLRSTELLEDRLEPGPGRETGPGEGSGLEALGGLPIGSVFSSV